LDSSLYSSIFATKALTKIEKGEISRAANGAKQRRLPPVCFRYLRDQV
jgi:hypothetical protein